MRNSIYTITFILFVTHNLFACIIPPQSGSADLIFDNSFEIPTLVLTPTNPPFELTLSSPTFYENISYGECERNVFDIFIPNSIDPTPLVVFIHGGGFTGGDKSIPYTNAGFQQLIDNLLAQNIAFATINYRFLLENETEGVLKPLNDSKRALQFIKYYSHSLNLDKNKVVLLGSSAGAGTSLWLAFSDDMSTVNSSDGVLRESTRVQGLVCTETQSSYDILEWHNSTFLEYQPFGLDFDSIVNLVGEPTLLKFYGVNSMSELDTLAIEQDRMKLDMLNLLTSDDPEFYLSNSNNDYVYPTTNAELLHHPLHSKVLMDKALIENVPTVVYLPSMNIDTRNGESIYDFIIRKIGN